VNATLPGAGRFFEVPFGEIARSYAHLPTTRRHGALRPRRPPPSAPHASHKILRCSSQGSSPGRRSRSTTHYEYPENEDASSPVYVTRSAWPGAGHWRRDATLQTHGRHRQNGHLLI
jgi:hypothetical protein